MSQWDGNAVILVVLLQLLGPIKITFCEISDYDIFY